MVPSSAGICHCFIASPNACALPTPSSPSIRLTSIIFVVKFCNNSPDAPVVVFIAARAPLTAPASAGMATKTALKSFFKPSRASPVAPVPVLIVANAFSNSSAALNAAPPSVAITTAAPATAMPTGPNAAPKDPKEEETFERPPLRPFIAPDNLPVLPRIVFIRVFADANAGFVRSLAAIIISTVLFPPTITTSFPLSSSLVSSQKPLFDHPETTSQG